MLHVTIKGLDKAVGRYMYLQATLEQKAERLCNELAQYGAMQAGIYFAQAPYLAGDNDVTVTTERDGSLYKIVASGRAVIFLEFGAGIGAQHPLGSQFGYVEDAWSSTHAKQYHTAHRWTYNGHTLTGVPAQRAMYYTGQELHKIITRKAKEIFND